MFRYHTNTAAFMGFGVVNSIAIDMLRRWCNLSLPTIAVIMAPSSLSSASLRDPRTLLSIANPTSNEHKPRFSSSCCSGNVKLVGAILQCR